jgi:hypothetical protein
VDLSAIKTEYVECGRTCHSANHLHGPIKSFLRAAKLGCGYELAWSFCPCILFVPTVQPR